MIYDLLPSCKSIAILESLLRVSVANVISDSDLKNISGLDPMVLKDMSKEM